MIPQTLWKLNLHKLQFIAEDHAHQLVVVKENIVIENDLGYLGNFIKVSLIEKVIIGQEITENVMGRKDCERKNIEGKTFIPYMKYF